MEKQDIQEQIAVFCLDDDIWFSLLVQNPPPISTYPEQQLNLCFHSLLESSYPENVLSIFQSEQHESDETQLYIL